jgi:glycosyltransferase involved in cell wall biosynthesis
MRIAYVSTYLPQRCGIATYTAYLAKGIREVEPEAEVKIVAERGASTFKEGNLEAVPCWSREESYVEPIIAHTRGADVVHIQHEYSIYGFDDRLPSLIEGLDPGASKVITIHCVRPSQFSERGALDEEFAKRIALLADQVLVHLESQEAILTRLGILPGKIWGIPHGTELSDADRRASRVRLGLPQEGRIMLMFGFIKRHKCLHIVLEALKEIGERVEDVYLFVAGGIAPTASEEDRKYIEFVLQRVRELDLQSKVIFPNRFFPNEDVPYIFGAADVVLFPYYEEDRSASGSFHLAIGAKKPIIASRIPKFEEMRSICDEMLVLPYNASGVARVAIRLFEEPEFARYVLDRTENYRRATSWQAIARTHLELYRRWRAENSRSSP